MKNCMCFFLKMLVLLLFYYFVLILDLQNNTIRRQSDWTVVLPPVQPSSFILSISGGKCGLVSSLAEQWMAPTGQAAAGGW